MNQDQHDPLETLLEGLSQHARFLSHEELKEELRERGVDVDKFLDKAHSIIARCQKEHRLAWMKVADEKEQNLRGREAGFETWVGKQEEVIKAAFERLISNNMPQRAVAFRNKTDLSIDDMARILDDHERLKLRSERQKPPEGEK